MGRLSSEKDHGTLLEAIRRLRGMAPEAHLVIVGDGPERPRIEKAIRALGLTESVTLTGQVPSAEPYYGIADICVLSSPSEGPPTLCWKPWRRAYRWWRPRWEASRK